MTMWVYTHTSDPPWGYGYEAGVQKSRPLPIPHDTHTHDPPWVCDIHAFAYVSGNSLPSEHVIRETLLC
jgi:hypothetical protein